MSKMDGSWKELATDDVTIMYQVNKNGEFTEMRTIDDDGTDVYKRQLSEHSNGRCSRDVLIHIPLLVWLIASRR